MHQKLTLVEAFTSPPTLGSNEPKASVDVAELNLHVPSTFAVTVTVLVSAASETPEKTKTKPKTIAKPNNLFIFLLLLFGIYLVYFCQWK